MKKYTLADLKKKTNKSIQGKIGMLTDADDTMDESVRNVLTNPELKLRSTIRVKSMIPSISDDTNRFKAPDDLLADNIIDILKRGASYGRSYGLSQTTPKQFTSSETGYLGREVAVDNYNNENYILFYDDESNGQVYDTMDHVGDWEVSGTAEDLRIDRGDFKVGTGALNFDIPASSVVAGIKETKENGIDLTDYTLANGEIFIWAKIIDPEKTTKLHYQIGTDASNYYSLEADKKYDGTSLEAGWNLISFSLVDMKNQVGTPDITDIKYSNIFWDVSDLAFEGDSHLFDNIVFHLGRPYDVKYYTRNVWVDQTTGEEKETGENDGDFLNINAEEWEILKTEAAIQAGEEADIPDSKLDRLKSQKNILIKKYKMTYPSQALVKITQYYNF